MVDRKCANFLLFFLSSLLNRVGCVGAWVRGSNVGVGRVGRVGAWVRGSNFGVGSVGP